jgi:hypothetical protein
MRAKSAKIVAEFGRFGGTSLHGEQTSIAKICAQGEA